MSKRGSGIVIAVIAVIVLGVAAWLFLLPGPMSFASGSSVALADYNGADPTGVPRNWPGQT